MKKDIYLERKFKEWFDMPLKFDDKVNNLIYETARISFYKGYSTPPPSIIDWIKNILFSKNKLKR